VVSVNIKTKSASIGDMTDGCIGCLLVFETKEQAGDENLVVQVDYKWYH